MTKLFVTSLAALLVVALALASPTRAAAQRPPGADTLQIHGTVRAADGSPVRGAEIVVEGTRRTTATDSSGRFALGVPHRRERRLRLRVIRLGYAPRTISVRTTGSEARVAAVLQPREVDLSALENRDGPVASTRSLGFTISVIHVSSP
ncbi:carboxypeptidase-like regulatory domain-containing protein [Longimicrobium sp.]|uniref:carboxypeptidase-like regulatory domain-containing protein n=1 Tax=Longimicrobium sp. TaxID=2029185 RepID=UPI002D004FEA|nr:carboxypeptidase-like regulatory domain-containing protein [Longimicrobium sp.]HSU15612.1 carboxypeptidase-like regulatory domain-containing protein [Longimicrobium sp.]